jgi:hypothetical protein
MIVDRPMDVMTEAERLGFHVEETRVDGVTVWGWRRGSDRDWPCFLTKGEALAWMEQGIRSASLFNRPHDGGLHRQDVTREARRLGWELEETYRNGRYVFRWWKGPKEAQFANEAEALTWMQELLAAPSSRR